MARSFLLADPNGVPFAELQRASGRGVRMPRNRLQTARFQTSRDNPNLRDLLAGEQTLVKVYDGSTLEFLGPITSVEKVSGTQTSSIAVTATGGGWRLAKRRIGKSKQGVTYGTALNPIDRGEIARQVIDAVNADRATGIAVGTITPSARSHEGPWYYKPALEAITDLSAPLDGYDWEIEPYEPAAPQVGIRTKSSDGGSSETPPSGTIGRFTCAPFIGSLRANAVFEYGTGRRNVAEFRHVINPEGLCNSGFNLPPGFPDNATQEPINELNQASIDARGLYEDVIQADLTVDDLRRKLVQEHVAVRGQPRQVITFSPVRDDESGRVPRFRTDYKVGDIVPFRAREEGEVTVDALFRIYAVDMAIDEQGAAVPTLALLEEEA